MESTIRFAMYASENLQAFDVSIEVDEKITAEAHTFVLVEMEALDKIVPSEVENLKPHSMASSIRCFFDLLLGVFPVNKLSLAFGNQAFSFIKNILVPLRHLQILFFTTDVIPYGLHDAKLLMERHLMNLFERRHT